jgi:hypothetical protein
MGNATTASTKNFHRQREKANVGCTALHKLCSLSDVFPVNQSWCNLVVNIEIPTSILNKAPKPPALKPSRAGVEIKLWVAGSSWWFGEGQASGGRLSYYPCILFISGVSFPCADHYRATGPCISDQVQPGSLDRDPG